MFYYKWRRTWDDDEKLSKKYWKHFFTLHWRKKWKRKERRNIVVVVLQNCLGKRNFSIWFHYQKKHHMTEFSILFFFLRAGTICILFFCSLLCCCRNVLQEFFFFRFSFRGRKRKENKRNEIESTRQILEQRQTTFRLSQKNVYWRPGKREKKSKDTSFEGKEKHVTHRLREDIAMNGTKSFAKETRKKGERLWRANTFLAMSCRKMTLVNLFFFPSSWNFSKILFFFWWNMETCGSSRGRNLLSDARFFKFTLNENFNCNFHPESISPWLKIHESGFSWGGGENGWGKRFFRRITI